MKRGGTGRCGMIGHRISVVIVLCAIFLVIASGAEATASSRAKENQDIIFLIDISSSMRPIFDDVRQAILEYLEEAQRGDNVVVFTFGEKVDLTVRQRVTSENDIESIERELAYLHPTDYSTYITGALERGMEELHLFDKKYPDHRKALVLLSDGKNNPPEEVSEPVSFETLLKRYSLLLKQTNSRFFYLSLGEDPDPEVLSFMDSVKGSSFNLGKDVPDLVEDLKPLGFAEIFVEPISIDLGLVAGPEATATASLAFFPARGDPSGKVITTRVNAQFTGNPSWKTIVEAVPAAVNCSASPWTQELTFNIDSLHEGTVVGKLELEPLTGQALFLDPPEIPITITMRQPYVKVLQEEQLFFGPIDPLLGDFRETQRVELVPNSVASRKDIRAKCGIVPPEGMTIQTHIEEDQGIIEVAVTVSTNDNFAPTHSMNLEGLVQLSGARRGVEFSKTGLEMLIEVLPPPARSSPVGNAFGKFLLKYGLKILFGILGTVALLAGAGGAYWWLRMRPKSALEGKLVLLNVRSKAQRKPKQAMIHLNHVGRTLRRDSLTVGSSKDAGITLPHSSVDPVHCEIYTRVDKGTKRIFIEPSEGKRVIVNLRKITGPSPLSDRDLVEIGAYTFRFENPHPLKQIVVKYVDGRILKGTPSSWDIESDGFGLLPRDALPGSTEEIYIPFQELKAVYFVRDFDGQLGKKIVSPASQIRGIHMRLTFSDGELMEGFSSQTYSPSSARFYFFPADQSGNTISMVVERENLKRIDILDAKARARFESTAIQ